MSACIKMIQNILGINNFVERKYEPAHILFIEVTNANEQASFLSVHLRVWISFFTLHIQIPSFVHIRIYRPNSGLNFD